MSRTGASPRGLTVAGCLLPWLATMLLIGSVPYLALYMGWIPGTDLLTEQGIEVKSPVGAVLAAVSTLLAIGALAWSLVALPLQAMSRRQRGGQAPNSLDERARR